MSTVYPLSEKRKREIVEQVRRYQETGGEEGYWRNGYAHVILTTKGRRSGEERHAPLIYAMDGDNVLVTASLGGYDEHPHWYRNLAADPHVTVQLRGDRYPAIARTATGEERARLWEIVCAVFPPYRTYQRRTEREIPVVVLERA